MSDLEQRLTEALTQGAQGAPAATGLADAARSRLRSRRRTRATGVAAAVALCVGVPAAVVATRDSDSADPPPSSVATDPHGSGVPDGLRVESWHSVTVLVPDSWEYGSLSAWCAGGGVLEARVERPGIVVPHVKCPTSTYGISFQPLEDNDEDFQWPVVQQSGGGYPDGAYVGARGIGDVLVWVTAPTQAEGLDVLATMREIGPRGDPYGCTPSRGEAPPVEVPGDEMRICRYDGQGLLEQSELLTGAEAQEAVAALEAAPGVPASRDCFADPALVVPVVRMRTAELHANVDLGGACPTIHGLASGDKILAPDVLYWALSPGWSGDGTGLPLPEELRRQ
jgi:hypothetical protein